MHSRVRFESEGCFRYVLVYCILNRSLNFTNNRCYNVIVLNYHSGSEDCLYLNVFVNPRQPSNGRSKQTLVWFHGGAFIFGGIDYYRGDYVMEYDDVILVTVQYRLNAFGFMSSEDEALPGNYGSLDQVEALRY